MSYQNESLKIDIETIPHGAELQALAAAAVGLLQTAEKLAQEAELVVGDRIDSPDSLESVVEQIEEKFNAATSLYPDKEAEEYDNGQAAAGAVAASLIGIGYLSPWIGDKRMHVAYQGMVKLALPHLNGIEIESKDAAKALSRAIVELEDVSQQSFYSVKFADDMEARKKDDGFYAARLNEMIEQIMNS